VKIINMPARRKLALAAALIAPLALGSSVYAAGQDSAEADSNTEARTLAAGTCSGRAQEAIAVRWNDAAQRLNVENVNTNITNGSLTRFVPAGDFDTFVVTFTSEAELNDGGANDSIAVQVLANGVAMDPVGPVSLTGSPQPSSNSATFCERLSGGATGRNYTFQARWRLLDIGGNNTLAGVLDDTTLRVETAD
jgi:hypothetical protein